MHPTSQLTLASACAERHPPLPVAAGWFASLALGLVLAGCSSSPSAAVPASAASRPSASGTAKLDTSNSVGKPSNMVALLPKSIFRTELRAGKDPFFPRSERRAVKTQETGAAAPLPLLSYLKLVGIRPGTTRPMALINRTPFAPGEEGDVSIVVSNQFSQPELQKINIRCLEIRRDSVLINIAGESGPKELRMAQGK